MPRFNPKPSKLINLNAQFLGFVSLILLLVFSNAPKLKAEVIHQEASLYRPILVEDNKGIRCLRFNNKRENINQTCIHKNAPNKLVFNYTKLLFSALLFKEKPEDILIIGLGGGTLSNALHLLLPDANITTVEIDPAMIKVAKQYFDLVDNEKVKHIVQDGRLFIKREKLKKQAYDWIILDAFNGDYIPEHLLTYEFLLDVKAILKNKGLVTSNTFIGSQLYQHESATYFAAFGDFYNIQNKENENRIILATKSRSDFSPQIMKKRPDFYNELKHRLQAYDINLEELVTSIIYTKHNHDWSSSTRILTDQYSPSNILNAQ